MLGVGGGKGATGSGQMCRCGCAVGAMWMEEEGASNGRCEAKVVNIGQKGRGARGNQLARSGKMGKLTYEHCKECSVNNVPPGYGIEGEIVE
jgi:hypothetical protein